jgi:hypothetical protein
MTWLDVADPPLFTDDGLPDPFRMIGNHVTWVIVHGLPLTHQGWTATHAGECPPGCTRLPPGAPIATGPTHAWYTPSSDPAVRQAIREAIQRAGGAPLNVPVEREVLLPITLRNRGGWNQYSCVLPEEPMPRILL